MANQLMIEALEADRAFAQRQIEALPPNPWGTAKLMWEQRVADLARQIEELRTQASKAASVALVFDGGPVVAGDEIRADFVAASLGEFQKIVSATFARLRSEQLGSRGKIPSANSSKLYVRDVVRGSFGFLLEESATPQGDLFETPLKNAVEQVAYLFARLNASGEMEFQSIVDDFPPRSLGAIQRFAKVLHDNGASAKIMADMHGVQLTHEDVTRLHTRLTSVNVQEERKATPAVLLGVLPDEQSFEIELEENKGVLKGWAAEQLIERYIADNSFKNEFLLQPITAHLVFSRTYRGSRLVKEQVILEDLALRRDES